MPERLDDRALDQLFRQARTYPAFLPRAIDDATIRELYELLKWGPTAFNAQPGRYLFVRSREAKEKLAPALSSGNRDKTLAAPLTVVFAWDTQFPEHLTTQWDKPSAKALFDDTPALVEPTALRSGNLQAAYLIVAARALGLDVGPMSGFKPDVVNEAFFPEGRWKANFLANIGYGDPSKLAPRGPRLGFDEVARIV